MDATISVLLGTVIGALASGIGVYIQQKFQNQRERQRMAVDLATLEYSRDIELAKVSNSIAFVAPLASYVICNADLLDAIADGEITPEKIQELTKKRGGILKPFLAPQPIKEQLMRAIAIVLNIVLIGAGAYLLSVKGEQASRDWAIWVLLFAAPISSLVTFYHSEKDSWLSLFFKRKALEEKKKIERLNGANHP